MSEDDMEHKHTKRKKSRAEAESGALFIVRHSLIGGAFALLIMLILSLAFSGIAYTRDDPDALLGVFSYATLYISALAAGYISAKRTGQSALAVGALSGAVIVLVLLLISVCFGDSYSSGYAWSVKMAIRASVILVSVLGGYIGVHKRSYRKRR
jgi:putative membrane protein (TIGR04086 family)